MSAPLDEASTWLVTADQPIREVDGLDFERCAHLHNAILRHAWLASRGTLDGFAEQTQTYWERYADRFSEDVDALHPSMVAYLKHALAHPFNARGTAFFIHLRDIWGPPGCFEYAPNDSDDEGDHATNEEEKRFIVLYCSDTEFGSHWLGLIYDQIKHVAMMKWQIVGPLNAHRGRKLEVILTHYIELIKRDKIIALPVNVDRGERWRGYDDTSAVADIVPRDPRTNARRTTENLDPWTCASHCAADVTETVEIWNEYVRQVEFMRTFRRRKEPPRPSIYTEETLEQSGIPHGFAYEFLKSAIRPKFKYILPGLWLLTPKTFANQPWKDLTDKNNPLYRPRGEWDTPWGEEGDIFPIQLLTNGRSHEPENKYHWCLWRFSEEKPPVPQGLYFDYCSPSRNLAFETNCVFELKKDSAWKGLGGPGNIYSDTNMSLAEFRDEDDFDFAEYRNLELKCILKYALSMVVRGRWGVTEDGVEYRPGDRADKETPLTYMDAGNVA